MKTLNKTRLQDNLFSHLSKFSAQDLFKEKLSSMSSFEATDLCSKARAGARSAHQLLRSPQQLIVCSLIVLPDVNILKKGKVPLPL